MKMRPICNRIEMRMACYDCGYPASEAAEDTDFTIPHIIYDFQEEFDQHFNEAVPDSFGG